MWGGQTGEIACLNFPSMSANEIGLGNNNVITIDCTGVLNATTPNEPIFLMSGNSTVKIRNLAMSGQLGGYPGIKVTGSGTLILENCVFENILRHSARH